MEEHHLRTVRTARYHTLGQAETARRIWVVLHGYGQLARYFLAKFEGLSSNCYIVAPEGLSRFYLDAEYKRVGASWMTREERELEIADQNAYLDGLLAIVRKRCPLAETINVVGFSQGVATAARWLSNAQAPVDRVVFWGGSLPPDVEDDAYRQALRDTRIDCVHGSGDTEVPESVHKGNYQRLRQLGLHVHEASHPGGHTLDRTLLQRLLTGS